MLSAETSFNQAASASDDEFDICVVGAGILGCAAAYSLGRAGYKVLLVERDWREPDRIVGELLQPGGMRALKELEMLDCVEGIDAIRVDGYAVFKSEEDQVLLPYPAVEKGGKLNRGVSFHHGKFIIKLREKARSCSRVTCIEGTCTELLQCKMSERYLGIKVKSKRNQLDMNGSAIEVEERRNYYAHLTVVADGCFSAFRKQFHPSPLGPAKSHFCGLILKDCNLPFPNNGHVVLAKPSPILLYQISTHDTRLLIDIPSPLPKLGKEMDDYLKDFIGPQLPAAAQKSYYECLARGERVRSMPCSWLPPTQNKEEGAILLGDAQNMRHPLTGGGMTVAFWDVVHLTNILKEKVPDLADTEQMQEELSQLHKQRKGLSSVVNILANALYELFAADEDPYMAQLQDACFAYFKLGGRCVTTPIGLLAGIIPKPLTLVGHFFAVAIYGTWLLITSSLLSLPLNLVKSFLVLYTACVVFIPLLMAEFW